MKVMRDHTDKISMIRMAVLWILIETTIIVIISLIFAAYIILKNLPDFVPLVLGIIGIANIGTIIAVLEKVIQKKFEMKENKKGGESA